MEVRKIQIRKLTELNFASQLRKGLEIWIKYVPLLLILVKVVANENSVKFETPKSLKRIQLSFSVDTNPRDSVPGKLCFLDFIKLANQ